MSIYNISFYGKANERKRDIQGIVVTDRGESKITWFTKKRGLFNYVTGFIIHNTKKCVTVQL